jgi:16S rRNA U516 pseudouridylate synthase RsuA-like enzyme
MPRADPVTAVITLDGSRIIRPRPPPASYKPRNVISSVDDPVGRGQELFPDAHLHPVGRLDWDSEGLVR